MHAKDIIALMEYRNKRTHQRKHKDFDIIEVLRAKKEELKLLEDYLKEEEIKKIPAYKMHKLTFAEGMIVAYVAQLILPPIWKAVAHNMGIQ